MNSNSVLKAGMFLIIISILFAFIIIAKNIPVPRVVREFFACLIYPLVWKIKRRGLHRGIAVIIGLLLFMVIVSSAILPLSIKLSNIKIKFPQTEEQFAAKTEAFQDMQENKLVFNSQNMDYYFKDLSNNINSSWQSEIGNIFSATTSSPFQLGILPVFVFFLFIIGLKPFAYLISERGMVNQKIELFRKLKRR